MNYKPTKLNPDFSQLLKVLRRETPDRTVLFEFALAGPVLEKLSGAPYEKDGSVLEKLRMYIQAFYNGGYDYALILAGETSFIRFPAAGGEEKKSRPLNEGSVIQDAPSFETYHWPDLNPAAYDVLEQIRPDLPEGMLCVNLFDQGIKDSGEIRQQGFSTPILPAHMEVYGEGQPLCRGLRNVRRSGRARTRGRTADEG